ncbi:hypothetical protein BD289DRAFT_479328 [Coniella lustricola]|uniref:G-patch domain-containing protein n=1 Tax=Coniella lustricola TaxID=2025994 RepID=A0A2T3AJA0_9PEZI|nr:hypothetical protein BD289DRAFT_479328 [Coniella lustricola]
MPRENHDDDDDDDGFDDVPLHHKRPFGSGLRRNEIKFVPASSSLSSSVKEASAAANSKSKGQSISDLYLNMVLKSSSNPPQASSSHNQEGNVDTSDGNTTTARRPHHHEASIAHQVCLTHSHPPSALNRTRMGLSVLEAQGWDPDARLGLGIAGQGTQFPLKAKPKDDNLGIGVAAPGKDESEGDAAKSKRKKREEEQKKKKPMLLDAKKVRKMAADDRKRAEELQRQLFGRVDLEKYLGKGA